MRRCGASSWHARRRLACRCSASGAAASTSMTSFTTPATKRHPRLAGLHVRLHDLPGDDPAFLAEVDAEAQHQIRRLRGHACLALWCGNNETEALEAISEHDAGRAPREWGRDIFHRVLPDALAELDDATPLLAGSPWAGRSGRAKRIPRRRPHAWEVWHGRAGGPFFTERSDDGDKPGTARHCAGTPTITGRFVSEFGILSAPTEETLDRWMPGVALHDKVFDAHLTDGRRTRSRKSSPSRRARPRPPGVRRSDAGRTGRSGALRPSSTSVDVSPHRGRSGVAAERLLAGHDLVSPRRRQQTEGRVLRHGARQCPLAVSITRGVSGDVEVWLVNNTPRADRVPSTSRSGRSTVSSAAGYASTAKLRPRPRNGYDGCRARRRDALRLGTMPRRRLPDRAQPVRRPGIQQTGPALLRWSIDGRTSTSSPPATPTGSGFRTPTPRCV